MIYAEVFLLWTGCLYLIHRLAHVTPGLKMLHGDHHAFIRSSNTQWHWSNLFLFTDSWKSTGDLWITEVLPTAVISAITTHWWIAVAYYIWAALLQEDLEHNCKVDYPLLTSGRWHMKHHARSNCNYGLFIPIWDKIFRTEQKVK